MQPRMDTYKDTLQGHKDEMKAVLSPSTDRQKQAHWSSSSDTALPASGLQNRKSPSTMDSI